MSIEQTASIPSLAATGTSIDTAISAVVGSRSNSLCGVGDGGLAPFLARLLDRFNGQITVVVERFQRARALARDLSYHLHVVFDVPGDEQVLLLPSTGVGPYDELALDRTAVVEKARALYRLSCGEKPRVIVVSAGVLQRKLVSRKEFESACLPIIEGDEIDRDELIDALNLGGYYRTPIVEEPGTYAVRGSLIDVFPPCLDMPVRVDMWGSNVDRIRSFDPETQASRAEIKEFWIHPIKLVPSVKTYEHRARIEQRLRSICDAVNQPTGRTDRLIEEVLSGRFIVGSQGMEPAYCELGSLIEYLPSTGIFCVENPNTIRLYLKKKESTFEADYNRRIESGAPSFPVDEFLVGASHVEEFFLKQKTIFVHPLKIAETEKDPFLGSGDAIDLGAVSTSDLGERLRRKDFADLPGDSQVAALARYLKALCDEGYLTTIVAHTMGQAERLASMLKGRGLAIRSGGDWSNSSDRALMSVNTGELSNGCVLPADGLCWITEEEVFGQRTRRAPASSSSKQVSLDDLRMLKPGDFVVHAEHGIGRYEGLVRQRVRNAEMDFLLIVYRDDDKLYLPVYRLNQIQKYRSAEAKAQHLDKLGGQTFAKTLSQAKKTSRELAEKLLDLYAKREASTRDPIAKTDDVFGEFEAAFPFEETADQEKAIDDVMADLESKKPMDRLVCGDVGFGKTEVALRAAFRIAMEGRQVAVLVPTTVLAQQHFQTFEQRFKGYPIQVKMLSRFKSASENSASILGLKDGTVDVVIGTHRLLSKDVHFKELGLLVIDEEHRFGVAHKERIRALKASVDTLVMTATPIPRTLQMAFGGIRDLSLIGTAPAARKSVKTMICHDDPVVIGKAIERELARSGQVFFVHNRVMDIHKVADRVQSMAPKARIAVGHGQMREDLLERVMLDFVAGRYDILVCTSIIESGLDIPRANTIIINRADMFGMAQLYQLRGRVGRSSRQAYAYLIIPPVSALSDEAKERVETLARYSNLGAGFSVATMDMEIRGAGNLLGPEQSGTVNSVGFEMFCDLLAEAAAEIRGETLVQDIEPELTFERPGLIPDDYLPEVGQRLQYYKRLASARSEEQVEAIAAEMIDRCGPLPSDVEDLIKVMAVKALARRFGLRGVEVGLKWLTVHLAPDSKVDPDRVIQIIREEEGRASLTNDLKIKLRFKVDEEPGPMAAIRFLHRLDAYGNNPLIS